MTSSSKMTLVQLAEIAGVAPSTASRALKNNSLIKKETRERIQALAKEHNFSLNHAASRLRMQKTNVVAVILNLIDNTDQSISDPFLLKIVGDLNQALNKEGYELLLSNSHMAGDDWDSYFIKSCRADGLLIIGQGKSTEKIDQANAAGAPMVVWGDPTQTTNYPVIGSNNELGGYLATKHLIDTGCSRIAFLGDTEHAEISQRYAGYLKALEESEIEPDPALTLAIDITSVAAYQRVNQVIVEQGLLFDGLVTASDMVAFGALKALKERYIAIPADVSLIGFDDIAMAELAHPSLTTIQQNTKLAAQHMVEQLLKQFKQQETASEVVDIQLIQRNSSKAI